MNTQYVCLQISMPVSVSSTLKMHLELNLSVISCQSQTLGMNPLLHRFISQVALANADNYSTNQIASEVSRIPKLYTPLDATCIIKSQLSRQLLEKPYQTSDNTSFRTSSTCTTSYLSEFISKDKPKRPLKVIQKKESPYPKFDVLGQFMSSPVIAKCRPTSKTQVFFPRVEEQSKNQTSVSTIRKIIDLKKYAKQRNHESQKQNINQNTPMSKNKSQKSLSQKSIKENLPLIGSIQKRKQSLADIFEPYIETPQQVKHQEINQLQPVSEYPSEQESSPSINPNRKLQLEKYPMEKTFNSIDLSQIHAVDHESTQEDDLHELESFILDDLKNDLKILSKKMKAATPESWKIHTSKTMKLSEEAFSYKQVRNRIETLRQKIIENTIF